MASSMLTAERRWAPTRKMTVLGKVPKPINLPSQRSENHGLDPNVEIVPKGTLTWGSKQSLAAPNAWGTSSSPNTDGSVGSPSHLSARPSSGGSGTRPSTAGSERSQEPLSNVWAPNSRPSSASGILVSNQISAAATRPRSAETRPGSSQLSRFAENSADSTVAWGVSGTAERLGAVSSKTTGFSLSSGDFPTLGSEKNSDSHLQRGHSSQGRPTSASSTASTQNEKLEPQSAVNRNLNHSDHGNAETWKAEKYPYVGHGIPQNMENWQNTQQVQPFLNVNMPPHQFDSWHNPPFHPSNGPWYRGGAAGGPYRPPGPHGPYPVDYPNVSARPLPNAQGVPRPEAGPGGCHPMSGESYRPHMRPEPYMGPTHPNIQVRPGMYPGPVPFEGYFGPPASFYNSNEREAPVMGAVRPCVYNQYPTQHVNFDPRKYHARPGGYVTALPKDSSKSDQAHETPGQYRVLLKPHEGWKDHAAQDQSLMPISPDQERGNQPGNFRQEGNWQTNDQRQAPTVSGWSSSGDAASSQPANFPEGYASGAVVRLAEDSIKTTDENQIRQSEAAKARGHDIQQCPVIKRNATLMEKLEGLNTKARASDCHSEVDVLSKERKHVKEVTTNADQFTKLVKADATVADTAPSSSKTISAHNKVNAVQENKNQESIGNENVYFGPRGSQVHLAGKSNMLEAGDNAHFESQKRIHGVKGIDQRAKFRSNKHENDEWVKKSPGNESVITNVTDGKRGPGAGLVCHASQEAPLKQELHYAATSGDGSFTALTSDPVDQKAQRAKIKEIAAQRAKKLQEEEEARTREQKAKALAKLEELNRRTLAESSTLKLSQDSPPSNDVSIKPELVAGAAPNADASLVDSSSGSCTFDPEAVKQVDGDGFEKPGEATGLSVNASQDSAPTQVSSMPQDQSLLLEQETNPTEITQRATSAILDNTVSKQKQIGYRRKQAIQQEKTLGEKKISGSTVSPKVVVDAVPSASSSDSLPNNEDASVQHKKKNNRSAKNKNKLDEVLVTSTLPPAEHTGRNTHKGHIESGKSNPPALVVEGVSVPAESPKEILGAQCSKDVSVVVSNQGWSESTEETHNRVSNQWKPHPSKKSARNQQANKPLSKYHGNEAVIWAPVKQPNKTEPSEEVNQKDTSTEATHPSGKSGADIQNGIKAKRAEMERYVPKPVAKELSQQGNSQQTSPVGQVASSDIASKPDPGSASVESGRHDESAVGKATYASGTRNMDSTKHNKHGKTHGSWRQRKSAQSPPLSQISDEVSSSIDTTKTVKNQLQMANEDSLPKGKFTHSDDGWNDNNDIAPPSELAASAVVAKNYRVNRQRRQPSIDPTKTVKNQVQMENEDSLPKGKFTYSDDGWNDNNDIAPPSELAASAVVAKNYGVNRQRRQPYKGRKAAGNYVPDSMDSQTVDISDTQSPALGFNESDGRKVTKTESQNAGGEHARPYWQPKSQAYSQNGRQGNRGNGKGQRIVSETGKPDKEYASQGTEKNTVQDGDNYALNHSTVTAEAKDEWHQEAKKERKVIPDSPELAPAIVDTPHEQPVSSGMNRQRQFNGRFQRRQDASYRGRDQGQDGGRQNHHANGDKLKNNPHLEYQQVGSYQKPLDPYQNNPTADREALEGSRNSGPRYREQRHHPRGGGQFYGRSSATAARVGDSYNSWE